MKSLAIIGSTGSIGKTSLKVFNNNKKNFDLIYLSANTNYKKLLEQKKRFKPRYIYLHNENNLKILNNKEFVSSKYALRKNQKRIDFVISGVSGFEALEINLKLVKICKNLLIANKETIICGGKFFLNFAKKNKCKIIPVDSEHYCLNYFLNNFKQKNEIKKIYLCASGGPFFEKSFKYNEKIKNVIKHPTWSMGKKISVDSSTFANKVLELFEAKILFNLQTNIIGDIIVEQKSNVHTICELKNNLYFPVMHKASMSISIANSLNVKNECILKLENLNFSFKKPNVQKFPIIRLGFYILKNLDFAGMILFTIFNERIVKKYLNNQIKYGDISKILVNTFKKKSILHKSNYKIKNLSDIKKLIKFGKKFNI